MAGTWDPAQYECFHAERRLPFDDLLRLLRPHPGARVVDLGCGTGALTAVLHSHLGASETMGVDSSPDMLGKAHDSEEEGLHFVLGDIRNVTAAWLGSGADESLAAPTFDIVFSNAALQWIPNHHSLLADMARGVAPGGQLAVQVPANADHVSHTAAYQVIEEEPFRSIIRESGIVPDRVEWVLAPDEYAALLDELGAAEQHVRLQVYGHRLGSTLGMVDWMKGSLLTPYRSIFDDATYAAFVTRYGEAIVEQVGYREPYFFTFKRILMWARF